MAADDLIRPHQLDETSCGPLCQHPQCWASNRRTERGLPRLKDSVSTSWNSSENEGALPTLNVQNLLADCGLSQDARPTQQSGYHRRSASASAVEGTSREKHDFPFAPHTSPFDALSSAQSSPSSLRGHRPTKAKSVEVREVFDLEELNSDWQKAFVPSQVYVWCPSKKSYERQLRKEGNHATETIEQSDVPKPVTVKDMTDEMVPKIPKGKVKKAKKMKKKLSRVTPTGGRPYTHPSRSPVPRKTGPTDVDESVARLLTLPRDILMDVLVHIQNSESLDKRKVQILLTRLMPLIHFDQNQPPHRALSPTPLLASGILQNKKIDLVRSPQQGHQTERLPLGTTGVPAESRTKPILDDGLVSAMMTSTYSALTQQIPMNENDATDKALRENLGRMAHKRPLGPIHADSTKPTVSVPPGLIRNKLTSVSTKSLPPLVPGSKPTKPFDYKAIKSLDLTLGPLSTPERLSPDKPSSPRSDKPSTLYVTLPSVPSPDRTAATTPLQPYGRPSPHPGMHHERFLHQYLRDTPSPIASEDFHPLHAVSPSLSTGVPKTPLGTPATFIHQSFKPASANQKPSRSPSPSKQTLEGPVRAHASITSSPTAEMVHNLDLLGTIQEVRSELVTSYPESSGSDVNRMSSRTQQNALPFSDGVAAVVHSDRTSRSPVQRAVTPATTPELWPVIDERDFMTSPDVPNETTSNQMINMATPMAPPPSPEPQEPKNNFDFDGNDVGQSRMVSLTPLTEGEEEYDSENNVSEQEKDLGEVLATEIWTDKSENNNASEQGKDPIEALATEIWKEGPENNYVSEQAKDLREALTTEFGKDEPENNVSEQEKDLREALTTEIGKDEPENNVSEQEKDLKEVLATEIWKDVHENNASEQEKDPREPLATEIGKVKPENNASEQEKDPREALTTEIGKDEPENNVSEQEKDLREALTTEIQKDKSENQLGIGDVQRDKDVELDNSAKVHPLSNLSQTNDQNLTEDATANESKVENALEQEITKERSTLGLPSTGLDLAEPSEIENNWLKESNQTKAEMVMKPDATEIDNEKENDQISKPTAALSDQKENPKSDETIRDSSDNLPEPDIEPETKS